MSETSTEFEPNELQPEEPQNEDLQDPQEPVRPDQRMKRLETENKRLKRQLDMGTFLRENPHVSESDLKFVQKDGWSHIAERLKPPDAPEPDPAVPQEIADQTQRLTQAAAGVAPTKPAPMSRRELEARLRTRNMSIEEYRQLAQEERLPPK